LLTIEEFRMKYRVLITLLLTLSMSVSLLAQKPAPAPSPSPAPPPQQPAAGDDDVVRITANLVQIDAVVTDKKGQQVTDLSDEDFEVLEDGRPQKITNLSYISTRPPTTVPAPAPVVKGKTTAPMPVHLRPEQVHRTIALVVDDLGLSFESMANVRQALKKFVDDQMQPGDLAAIIRTAAGTGALQQFTGDKRQLYAAIEHIRWNPGGGGHVGAFAPIDLDPLTRLRVRAASSIPGAVAPDVGGTDQIEQFRRDVFAVGTLGALKYVVQGMRTMPGRKSVILMSDGITIFTKPLTRDSPGTEGEQGSSASARQSRDSEGNGVRDALRRLTDFANRASVVIYTMDARGLPALGLSAADNTDDQTVSQVGGAVGNRAYEYLNSQEGLNYLSQQTGGFLIHDNNDLAGGIEKVLDDQKGYYLIGYRPEDATFNEAGERTFHDLKVRVKRSGLKVRARTGFFGVTDEAIRAVPVTGEQQLLETLVSPFSSADVHLRLTSLFGSDSQGRPVLRALLHIDGRDLTFTDAPEDWHQLRFEVMAVTFGDSGVVADKYRRAETMRVRDEAYRQAQQQGLIYTLNVPLQNPGAYQLRVAVRDSDSKRIGSASQFVEVPDLKKGQLALSGIVIEGLEPVMKSGARLSPASVSDSPGNGAAAGAETEPDPQAGPAVRRLHPGMTLNYVCSIYNAVREKQSLRPRLQTQVRLFRATELLDAGKLLPLDVGRQADMKPIPVVGTLQLGAHEQPGEYFLQVIVTDLLADKKHNTTTSWIDFEIVK
jgi:VWFA-related protein